MPDAKRTSRGSVAPIDVDKELDKAFPSTVDSPFGQPPLPPKPAADPRMGIPSDWPMAPTLIARVLAEVGPVLKDQEANAGGARYNFRGIDQVVNAVNRAFKIHQIFPTSKIETFQLRDTHTTGKEPRPTREATLRVTYRFTAPDGTFVETEVPGEALDTGDKATPKAMSVALRIALLQMLLLPTGDPTTDHEILSREGVGPMSGTTAAFVLAKLRTAPLSEVVGPMRAMISEHGGWDRPASEGGATWSAEFADRLAWIIDLAEDMDALQDIHLVLQDQRLLGASTKAGTMLDLLKARWVVLRDLYLNTLNHVVAEITAARSVEELEQAIGCGYAALEAKTLRVEDLVKAEAIAEDRRPKLPAVYEEPVQDVEPGDDPDAEAATELDEEREAEDPGYLEDEAAATLDSINADLDRADALPPVDTESAAYRAAIWEGARQDFARAATAAPLAGLGELPAIREHAVKDAIVDLINGVEDGTNPAATFGYHGFQLVRDAITAAHRREQTIGTPVRELLEAALREAIDWAQRPGATAPEANQ